MLTMALGALLTAACTQSPEADVAARWGMLDRYCADCHNPVDLTAELSFDGLAPADVAANPELWEEVVRKLRGHLMPPPGGPRPAGEEVDAFVAALEASLDVAAESRGAYAGHVALHRLNRTEYGTAVEELLGVNIDAGRLLPADIASDGFDNVAEVLRVTPTFLDQYIAAARAISIQAVGDGRANPVRTVHTTDVENHTRHVDGLPLGTRDGLVVEHYFPADGEYVFSIDVNAEPGAELRAYPQGWLEHEHRAILTIDGNPVYGDRLGGEAELRAVDQQQISAVNAIRSRFHDIRMPVKAGYHRIGAAFAARSFAESDYLLESFIPGEGIPDVPRILGLEIVGPYDASGISGPTRSRERIFICYPETAAQERPCAERILTRLARLAFRRPVTDADMASVLGFYESGHAANGFEGGIQRGLFAILSSTKFLYRAEPGGAPEGLGPGDSYPIGDLELAWRLAFFLWSAGPDERLLELAENGELGDPEVYAAEVERMLADPRSSSLVSNFGFQWLSVPVMDTIDPDPRLYPNFDEDLRRAFRREIQLFLDSILRDGEASVVDLLTAPYTFVNERLARHYGIEGVRGDRFRRVELDDPNRWGLLGKGSVHVVTSYPDRTSPVLRGAWIMDHLLGTPPASPPPGVETNLPQMPGDAPKSVRERLEQHRSLPSCNNCHGVIDPLGQPLENFNAIGEWREIERDSGVAIDPGGELAGGVAVDSPVDLRNALAGDPEQFVRTLTGKLMTYALGRTIEYYDMPAVRRIVRDAGASDYSFAAIVAGIAESEPFRMRSLPRAAEVALAEPGSRTENED